MRIGDNNFIIAYFFGAHKSRYFKHYISSNYFLVAAVRLLPAMNSIFQNFNIINLEMDSVRKLYEELKQYDTFFDPRANKNTEIKIPSHDFSNFTSVTFEKLFFSYGNNEVIRDLNFEINKGDFIGLLGKSGEGKTTLVDLMLGIHKPLNGDILSNGVSIFKDIDSWRDNLAYLPQETFLINTSIAENIAIGENITKEVENKIKDAISKAGLADVVESSR